MNIGYDKGEICNRNCCDGIIAERDSDECCSCHINAPCSYCTDSRVYCPKCEWDGREEQITENKESEQDSDKEFEMFKPRTMADLDRTKIDYLCLSHTHFSMVKKGVFPKGTSKEEVREKVIGTFGGRFSDFNEETCEFEYIAYTD